MSQLKTALLSSQKVVTDEVAQFRSPRSMPCIRAVCYYTLDKEGNEKKRGEASEWGGCISRRCSVPTSYLCTFITTAEISKESSSIVQLLADGGLRVLVVAASQVRRRVRSWGVC